MGGGNDKASKQAEQNERERQAKINDSVSRINAIFNDPSRQGQYDQLAGDTTAFLTGDIDRQKAVADRQLKFAMARNGQAGGSVQVDQNKRMGEDYLRAVIEAQRRGNAAGADLRAADEQSRGNLLGMAQAGLDATTAASQSANLLRNNLLSGKATSTAGGMADVFGGFADVYTKSQEAKGLRRGQLYDYRTTYQPGFGYGSK
jgi:hypothetical protein